MINTQIQKFIKELKNNSIKIDRKPFEDSKIISLTIGEIELEFILYYKTEVKSQLSATYLQPGESEIELVNSNHEDITLYKGDKMIEITDQQLNEIDRILNQILY